MNKSVQKKVICSLLATLNATSVVSAAEKSSISSQKTLHRSKSAINSRSVAYSVLGVGMGISYLGYSYKKGKFPFNKTPLLPPTPDPTPDPTPQPNPQSVISTPCLTNEQIEYWKNNLQCIVKSKYGEPKIGAMVFDEDENSSKWKPNLAFINKEYLGKHYANDDIRLDLYLKVDSAYRSGKFNETIQEKFEDLKKRKPDFAKRGEMMLRLLKCTINNDDEVNALAEQMRENGYFDDKHTCITISPTELPNKDKKIWFVLDGDMPNMVDKWEVRHQFLKLDEKGVEMKFDYGLFFCDGHGDNDEMNWRKTIYKIYSDKVEKLEFPK